MDSVCETQRSSTDLKEVLGGLEGNNGEAQQQPDTLCRLGAGVVGGLAHALHVDFVPQLLPLQPRSDDGLQYLSLRLWLKLLCPHVLAQFL